jgi:hypothetical protein
VESFEPPLAEPPEEEFGEFGEWEPEGVGRVKPESSAPGAGEQPGGAAKRNGGGGYRGAELERERS